ncbi:MULTISPECIES: hypothetical protein [Dysgonomonas]|uniref:hypothetical protein n=1 Tax=Dysgonomonas TaxID=156973 RepID=UPI000A4FF0B1|nr:MULTISPECIES: hypothetical protein [Dysgonomonas]MBN9300297.1 hypothetical protein [Dysgonomonas mossii]
MGSRTNFGISTYRHNDLSNICIIMPSLSMKYFYPQNVQKGIIDDTNIDILKVVEAVSGWEGDDITHTAQEYLPTVILLQGSSSNRGSFVINYLKDDRGNIFYRVLSFSDYKTANIDQIEKDLRDEMQIGQIVEHGKELDNLIRNLI